MARLEGQYDDMLARWAAVMLNSDMYAEIIDRHVELADDVTRIANVLYVYRPEADPPRLAQDASLAAATDEQVDDEQLAEMVVAVAQLAERLDQLTLDLATRVVPIDWWRNRPGHVPNRGVPSQPSGLGSDR